MKTIQKSYIILIFSIFFLIIVNVNAQENRQWEILNEGFSWHLIDFINENVGWIAGNGKILITKDGALTWNSYPIDVSWRFSNIDFINENFALCS
jgi:hypothetical protein